MVTTQEERFESRGFTLLELIVVMTIIAMMSAAVVPIFSGTFNGIQRNHAMRDFTATLRYAQERAVAETREYRVMLNPEERCYYVTRYASKLNGKKSYEEVNDKICRKKVLPRDVEMKTPTAQRDRETHIYYVAFYPNAACDEAKIPFMVNNRRAVNVTTNGTKGLIRMEELK